MKPKLLALLAALSSQLLCWSQNVPALVNYQGKLTDAQGNPLPTGDYILTFRITDDAKDGLKIWGAQIFDGASGPGHGPKIPVVQGYFNVMLGPVDDAGRSIAEAFNGPNRFVEVQVGSNPPIKPRQQILSAPYAIRAQTADTLGGFDWSVIYGTGGPKSGNISGSSVSAQNATFAGLKVGGNQLVVANGKVGVGTPNPAATLDVAGSIQGNVADGGAAVVVSGSGSQKFGATVGGNNLLYVGRTTGPGAGVADDFTIDQKGQVAIKTNLTVKGDVNVPLGTVYADVQGKVSVTGARLNIEQFDGSNAFWLRSFHDDSQLWFALVNAPDDRYIQLAVRQTGPSDARLKENIVPIAEASAKIGQLKGVNFTWKKDSVFSNSGRTEAGVLAQDVRKVMPEAVHEGSNGLLSVDYMMLIPLLIQSQKEQMTEISRLRAEIESLKAQSSRAPTESKPQ